MQNAHKIQLFSDIIELFVVSVSIKIAVYQMARWRKLYTKVGNENVNRHLSANLLLNEVIIQNNP